MRTPVCQTGICVCAKSFGVTLISDSTVQYLQESEVGLATYPRFYEQQWSDLMASDQLADAPLQYHPDRSVWTTSAISHQAIREKHEATENLLLLLSFLHNKDLWHGLFATACASSSVVARMLLR
jgi:hypothetical protein